jgi:hypothetical protein
MIGDGAVLPPHYSVDTVVAGAAGGSTTGDGVYTNGTKATVTALPNAGYGFANWTENGAVVSTSASYQFTNIINRSLVANFGPQLNYWPAQPRTLIIAWLTNFNSWMLQESTDLRTTNWTTVSNATTMTGSNYQVNVTTINGTHFFRLAKP